MEKTEQSDRIITLEVQQTNIMQELKEIKETLRDFKQDFKEFVESADKKYSAKWVERALLFAFWVIWSTIIWSFMILILK